LVDLEYVYTKPDT